MLKPCFVTGMLLVGIMVSGTSSVLGQNYPNKPVRIVTIETGGGGDFSTRLLVPGLSSVLGQPIVVENRATGLASDIVAKAPPDGYTLLYFGTPVWIAPLLQNTTYDAIRDFAPISFTASSPNIVVVHPSLPVKTIKELIALAKARPGALNYATAATGSGNHLAGELFKAMAHVDIVGILTKAVDRQSLTLSAAKCSCFFPARLRWRRTSSQAGYGHWQ